MRRSLPRLAVLLCAALAGGACSEATPPAPPREQPQAPAAAPVVAPLTAVPEPALPEDPPAPPPTLAARLAPHPADGDGEALPDGVLRALGTRRWRGAAMESGVMAHGGRLVTSGRYGIIVWNVHDGSRVQESARVAAWGAGLDAQGALVAFGTDGLWRLAPDGSETRLVELDARKAMAGDLSPDGRLAAYTLLGELTVVELAEPTRTHALRLPEAMQWPAWMRFTDDGRHLVLARPGQPLMLVALDEAGRPRRVPGVVAGSPDHQSSSARLLEGDGVVQLDHVCLELATGERVLPCLPGGPLRRGWARSGDGQLLSDGAGTTLRLYPTGIELDDTTVAQPHGHRAPLDQLAFDPAGEHVVAIDEDGQLGVWALDEAALVGRVDGYSAFQYGLKVSGTRLVLARHGHARREWLQPVDAVTEVVLVEDGVPAVALEGSVSAPLEARVLFDGVAEPLHLVEPAGLERWTVRAGEVWAGADRIGAVLFRYDARLAGTSEALTVHALGGELTQGHTEVHHVGAGGEVIFSAFGVPGRWDGGHCAAGRVRRLQVAGRSDEVAVSADDRTLVFSSPHGDGRTALWRVDAVTLEPTGYLEAPWLREVTALAVSADGSMVAAGLRDTRVLVLDAAAFGPVPRTGWRAGELSVQAEGAAACPAPVAFPPPLVARPRPNKCRRDLPCGGGELRRRDEAAEPAAP